jgi:sugar lactone lactonase YvrE
MTSDSAGNLYYVDGISLYTIPAGSNTASVTNSSSLLKPNGVTLDPYGNLLISDTGNSRIVTVPLVNGKLDFTQQYTLAPYYSKNSVGIDSRGTIYYTGTGSTSINALQTSVYQVPSLAVGTTSATALVYAAFNSTVTFSQYVTRGYGATVGFTPNSCTLGTTYTAGQSCGFNANLKPTRVGQVSGVIGIGDAAGNFLSQFTFAANGQGSAVNIDPGAVSAIGSGFKAPTRVAVDRAGNVFVADSTANVVYELVGGTGTPVALGTGLLKPNGVAVDDSGDLFIADSGNARIVEIPVVGSSLQPSQQFTVVSNLATPIAIATGPFNTLYLAQSGGLSVFENRGYSVPIQTAVLTTHIVSPGAVTVDASGNVFVADDSTGQVVEYAAYTNVGTTVASGLTAATSLALDAAGDLFLVDSGTGQVLRIPNLSGTLTQSQAVSLGAFASPYGIALDGAGKAYVTDTSVPALYAVARTTAVVDFGNISLGTTSPAKSASLVSSGTQSLFLGTPAYVQSGDSAHFAVASSTTCTSGLSLSSGSSCALTASFSPAVRGVTSSLLAVNASPTVAISPLNVTLTGNGTFQVATTLTVSPVAGTISYGQPVTFIATLAPASFNVANATGTVTFSINGVQQKPIALNGTTASITVLSLPGGQNSISASYSGDLNYAASLAPAVLVTVATATTTTSLSIGTSYTNPTSSLPGGVVTLTAVITPSVAGVLDGTVSFTSGGTILGTASVTPSTGGNYQATFTSTTIPAGSYSITATYSGNANYLGSTSSSAPLLVAAAGIQMTANPTSITSTPSVAGSTTLTVASVSGLGSSSSTPVSFSCSGLPAYAKCIFNPAYISLAGSPASAPVAAQQVVLSVQVNVPTPTSPPPVTSLLRDSGDKGLVLAAFLIVPGLMRSRRRRLRKSVALSVLFAAVSLGLSGCGSTSPSITPLGTTPITVTAFSTSASTSITINLTVKN